MQLLFNTIMLEVNRWSADKKLTFELIDLLPEVKKAGFRDLEIWQYHISSLDRSGLAQLGQRLDELGMQVVAVGAYPQFHLEAEAARTAGDELEMLVDYAATLGATAFKIFPGRVGSEAADAAVWQQSVHRIGALAAATQQRGMMLTLETHGNTLCDTLDSTRRLLADLQAGNDVGICFQPYSGQDTDAALAMYEALAAAVRHIHLQNRSLAENACTLLAEGDWIDCRRLLQHARNSGFDGLLCLEFTAGLFPPEGRVFDPGVVIANAARDRDFVLDAWQGG